MSATIHRLTTAEQTEWNAWLKRALAYDFYHLAEYHALAERAGEGTATLFICDFGSDFIALPLLLRPVGTVDGITSQDLQDATSVYGYVGPVGSLERFSQHQLTEFQESLAAALRELRVAAAFSRLHPLLPQSELLSGFGEIQTLGQTVSIDLSLPAAEQRAKFRKNHKEGINRLRKSGVECIEDVSRQYLDDFVSLYRETMQRVDAAALYFFDREYFESLLNIEPAVFHLFVARQNGEVVAGGIFSECCGIVQYHLGGTLTSSLKTAPMKLIFDTVRLWATERGQRVFHLGGGVGSQEDSLFAFKAGFSDRRHDFSIWRCIVDRTAYDDLTLSRNRWLVEHNLAPASTTFFPAYRAPAVPPAPVAPAGTGI